jgi:hypothetical protein
MFFSNFTYPLRCLHVPPGVRVPQVEYHCFRIQDDGQRPKTQQYRVNVSVSYLFKTPCYISTLKSEIHLNNIIFQHPVALVNDLVSRGSPQGATSSRARRLLLCYFVTLL